MYYVYSIMSKLMVSVTIFTGIFKFFVSLVTEYAGAVIVYR